MSEKITDLKTQHRPDARSTWRQARATADRFFDLNTVHVGRDIALLVCLLAALVGVVWLVWLLGKALLFGAASAGHAALEGWNTMWPVLMLAADAVTEWITGHAVGLPVPSPLLLQLWAIAGVVSFILAVLYSVGARIGWAFYGAATTAMAYFGTAVELHRPVVAGIAALAWCACSVLTYARPVRG